MNIGTAIVLIIVIVAVALALRSVLRKKSTCSCGCSDAGSDKCAGCAGATKVYGINVDADGLPLECSVCSQRCQKS